MMNASKIPHMEHGGVLPALNAMQAFPKKRSLHALPGGLSPDVLRNLTRTWDSIAMLVPSADTQKAPLSIHGQQDFTASNVADVFSNLGMQQIAIRIERTRKFSPALGDPGVKVFCEYG